MNNQVKAVRQFCNTIGRIRYFTERKRHWSEKFWWVLAFGLSAWLCASSIQHIWIKWNDRPVTLSFTEKEYSISEIPFPTIVICPETKAMKEKFDVVSAHNKLTESQNLTKDELTYMEAMAQICEFFFPNPVHFGEKFINESIYQTIRDLASLFDSTFRDCFWQHKRYNCSKLFLPTFTDEGLCYAFNALNSEDIFTEEMAPEMMILENSPMVSHWNSEDGYDDKVHEDEYPIRIFNAKNCAALELSLEVFERDIEYLCQPFQGYKVYLNAPGQHLKMTGWFYRVSHLQEVDILIKPTLTFTTDDLRSYNPNQRQCFFNSERLLRFFKMYTKDNCEAECLANYTKSICGCVKFSMPRTKGTRICGAGSVECYRTVQNELFGEDIIIGLKHEHAKSFREQCNCLPSCTTIDYDGDIYKSKLDLAGTLKYYQIPAEQFSGVKPSHLWTSFKEHKVMTLRRSALYTYADFMAICGGLLGLFLGISAMNVIQFIYYSTIRLYLMVRYFKSKNVVAPFRRSSVVNRISIEAHEAQRARTYTN